MNEITLAKDGSILHSGRDGGDDPLRFLGFRVELETEYTLRSFMKMFLRYPLLMRLNAFLPSYLDRYRASSEKGCTAPGLDRLELGKTVEIIGYPGKPRLEIYTSLYGVQGEEPREIRSIQMESLLDLPFRLGTLKHVVFGDKMDVLTFETALTLFEFIDGIAWDLSFHAVPAQCALRR